MKKFVMSVVAAATMCGGAAIAADMPVKARPVPVAVVSPWDWAFGGALMSDYNFRGISQSNRGPSVTAYSETRYNVNSSFQLYLASQYWAVTLPTNPTAEVDIYGGVALHPGSGHPRHRRHVLLVSARAAVRASAGRCAVPDLPNGNVTLADTDFWEVYGKLSWEVVKDKFAVGANVYYSPDWLNTGADGLFATVTAKVTLPSFKLNRLHVDEIGWYISGEGGCYWLGTADALSGRVRGHTPCPTMRPGTSAWPSPGRSRPSTCATTTPTCRRRTATS